MSQLQYSEIREKKIIIYNNEPCLVVESHVARTQQRKPQNQVKLKSLISGKVFPATFHVADSAYEADIAKREVTFLYENRGEYWFCDPNDKANRFKLDASLIGNSAKFLKQYVELGIYKIDPFETIDQEGVGELMKIAIQKAKPIRPGI